MLPRLRSLCSHARPGPVSLIAGAAVLLGCAAPCERIRAEHADFRRFGGPAPEPGSRAPGSAAHLSLSLPYELLDSLVARQLDSLPTLSLPLPAIAGQSLGRLRLRVTSVRAGPAPAGELGFRIGVELREGKRSVLRVDVDARVRPRIDAEAGELSIALSGRDLVAIDASLSRDAKRSFGDWVWSKLPAAARSFVDRGSVRSLAGEAADQLVRQASELVRRDLLDELGELARFELDLPPQLPIAAVDLAAGDRYLDIDLRTPLRVVQGLPAQRGRSEGFHPNLVQLRLSGDAAAALVNRAIRTGEIPERWTLAGEPDPEGPIHAGVAWAEGVKDPLEVHLWLLEGDCAHVVLRGRPLLSVRGSERELGASEAKVARVDGSAKVRAGLFFSRTARRGLDLIETTAARTELELAGQTMGLSIAEARVADDEVVLGLRLLPARAPSRSRRSAALEPAGPAVEPTAEMVAEGPTEQAGDWAGDWAADWAAKVAVPARAARSDR